MKDGGSGGGGGGNEVADVLDLRQSPQQAGDDVEVGTWSLDGRSDGEPASRIG